VSRLRWVPAKAKLGQSEPMISAPIYSQEQPAPADKRVFLEKVIYGGLILAGAAAFITFVFGKD